MDNTTANLNFNLRELLAISAALHVRQQTSSECDTSITKIDRAIKECKLEAKWKAENELEASLEDGYVTPELEEMFGRNEYE